MTFTIGLQSAWLDYTFSFHLSFPSILKFRDLLEDMSCLSDTRGSPLTINTSICLQRDALTQVGCERIYKDTVSGAQAEREGLTSLINALRPCDTVVIWRLDRLRRSLKNSLQLVELLDRL